MPSGYRKAFVWIAIGTGVLVLLLVLIAITGRMLERNSLSQATGENADQQQERIGEDTGPAEPASPDDSLSGDPQSDGSGPDTTPGMNATSDPDTSNDTTFDNPNLGYADDALVTTTYYYRDLIFDFPDSWSIGETPEGFIHARKGDDLESEGPPIIQISEGLMPTDYIPFTEDRNRARLSYLVSAVYTAEDDYDGPGGEPVTQSRIAHITAAGNDYTIYYAYPGPGDEDAEQLFDNLLRSLLVYTGE